MSITKAINTLDHTLNYLMNEGNIKHNKYKSKPRIKQQEKDNIQLKWPSHKVRQTFIDYFVNKHEHQFIESSSVIPTDDQTLKFTNAGMNQFKPIFLGNVSNNPSLSKPWRTRSSANSCK